MALKDSEFEQILKEALNSDNAIPSAQLNEKLKERLRTHKKPRYFSYRMPQAVAAAVLAVAVIGVGGYIKESNPIVNNTNISMNENMPRLARSTEIDEGKTREEIAPKSSTNKNASATANTKNIVKNEAIKTDKELTTKSQTTDLSKDSQTNQTDNAVVSTQEQSQNDKSYKYLEIKSSGLGEALDNLNETVNYYIDGLLGTQTNSNDMVMVASARGITPDDDDKTTNEQSTGKDTSTEQSQSDLLEALCSYEVLCDNENFYSVMTTVKTDEEYKKSFTVDKSKNIVVSLGELLGENTKAYEEINNNLQKQLNEDRDFSDVIYEISGHEEFFINKDGELVIIFGEKEFNVGKIN